MTFKLYKMAAVLCSAAVVLLAGTVGALADAGNDDAAASSNLLGDADTDGKVTILDATCIQRHLASLPVTSFANEKSDANCDGKISILDATAIQRWLASLEKSYPIGLPIETTAEPTEPAGEIPVERPTDAEGWGRDIFRP